MKERVLFLCSHNSAHSQMAEGLLKELYGDRYEVYSAGIEPTYLNPYAVKVMDEVSINISSFTSKSITNLGDMNFDLIVTVCDQVKARTLSRKTIYSQEFPRPHPISGKRTRNSIFFRIVRDQIKNG